MIKISRRLILFISKRDSRINVNISNCFFNRIFLDNYLDNFGERGGVPYTRRGCASFAADFRPKHYKYHPSITSSRTEIPLLPPPLLKFPRARELLERVMTHVEVRTSKRNPSRAFQDSHPPLHIWKLLHSLFTITRANLISHVARNIILIASRLEEFDSAFPSCNGV